MGRVAREQEGGADERRRAARKARSRGKLPSEEGVTLGASKQLSSAKNKSTRVLARYIISGMSASTNWARSVSDSCHPR